MKLNIKLEVKDEESQVVSSDNIKEEIAKILRAVHTHPEKHDVKDRDDGFAIACPYCGDSNKSMSKKRGIVYLETSTYKCWNGGCFMWKPLDSFFRDFNSEGGNIIVKQFSYENLINKAGGRGVNLLDLYSIKEQTIDRAAIMKAMNLEEIVYNEKSTNYMLFRKQDIKDKCFATRWNGDIIMFNIHRESERVIGLQLRIKTPKKGGARFISYDFKDLMVKILKREDFDQEEALKIKRIGLTFNLLNVDLAKPINIFESTMNSTHFPNSVACWGSNNIIELENGFYFLDDDKAGRTSAIKLLEKGMNVFMWRTFRKDFPIYDGDEDFDDIYRKKAIGIKTLQKYCSNNRLDIMNL